MDVKQASQSVEWVFAYGSLIWNPEFDHDHAELTRVHGFHRSFCIRSIRHRGTPEAPGVVLGLDRGGSCVGMVYRLAEAGRAEAVRVLYDREMQQHVYVPRMLSAALADGRRVHALTFVANRASVAYERLTDDEIVRRMNACRGQRGLNREYLLNTLQSLESHGVRDDMLRRLGRLVRAATPACSDTVAATGAEPDKRSAGTPDTGSTPGANRTLDTIS